MYSDKNIIREFIMKKNVLTIVALAVIIIVVGFYFFSQNFKTNEIGEVEETQELKIEVLKEGSGPEAKKGDTITIHYIGTFRDGTKFDSSLDKGKPFVFTLGSRNIIMGWNLGVSGMKVGEKRRLIIPSELGYGERGTPGGEIPTNATLIFEVELLALTSFTNE